MLIRNLVVSVALLAGSCLAQNFEIGGAGGLGVTRGLTVTNGAGSADAGLKNGPGFSAVATDHLYRYISGDLRYTYRQGDLRLSRGGAESTFGAQTHSLHYDFLFFARERGARIRPFGAAGAGVRLYRGTGIEAATQPLSSVALLAKTQQYRPLLSLGGGVEAEAAPRVFVRLEFRDYMSPAPDKLIVPGPGSTSRGWLHDLTPMIGLSFAL